LGDVDELMSLPVAIISSLYLSSQLIGFFSASRQLTMHFFSEVSILLPFYSYWVLI